MATNEIKFNASSRTDHRKGAVGRLRTEGKIPGVVYGGGSAATPIEVDEHAFTLMIQRFSGENLMLQLSIDDAAPRRVLLKSLETHPITRRILHLDFHEVTLDRKVTVKLPLNLVGESKGVAQGGTLDVHLRSVVVQCKAGEMLDHLDVDITNLDVGQHLQVKHLALPKGFRLVTADNVSVVTVLKPRVARAGAAES